MQDYDHKHTFRLARSFFQSNNMNWWKKAPKSPDLNPIDNIWHELKGFIRHEAKPRSKEQLIQRIRLLESTKQLNEINLQGKSFFDYQFCVSELTLETKVDVQ